RHAPQDRFPAAVDDALVALRWVADNAAALGGDPNRLAVAGWSAGGNQAAVVSQLARDAGGPAIGAQLLLTPVTDFDLSRPSYNENADGYVLTRPLMEWFADHYVDAADRADPRAAPLRAASLADLPPAIVVTAQLDPLRDEGFAYAEAMAAAGVAVEHIRAKGHTHTSLTMIDVVASGVPVREQMAESLRKLWAG
ncbi:MAG: alpha/beta hydrolase, partial [Acidimicrobiia bacterium]|nr:alpha/beta hydrolase [Acidimicrobiia bacterium]